MSHLINNESNAPCKLLKTVEGYSRNCCQLAMSVRIQVSPMTVVSLIQIRRRGTRRELVTARPAPCIENKRRFALFMNMEKEIVKLFRLFWISAAKILLSLVLLSLVLILKSRNPGIQESIF